MRTDHHCFGFTLPMWFQYQTCNKTSLKICIQIKFSSPNVYKCIVSPSLPNLLTTTVHHLQASNPAYLTKGAQVHRCTAPVALRNQTKVFTGGFFTEMFFVVLFFPPPAKRILSILCSICVAMVKLQQDNKTIKQSSALDLSSQLRCMDTAAVYHLYRLIYHANDYWHTTEDEGCCESDMRTLNCEKGSSLQKNTKIPQKSSESGL